MIRPSGNAKELRNFALTIVVALGILGGILVWRNRDVGFVLWAIGSIALLIGLIRPKILGPAYKYWMKLSFLLGLISSHVILTLLYYLVFTPIGVILRISGKNRLNIRYSEKKTGSYWVQKEKGECEKQRYEKMF